MSQSDTFLSLLKCPRCAGESLQGERDGFSCGLCQLTFPAVGQMPWLFRDPESTVWEWKSRYDYYLQSMLAETEELKMELRLGNLLKETEDRLRRLIQAKTEQVKQMKKLLEPLAVTEEGRPEFHKALHNKIPEGQSLMGYYVNVLRDWSFAEEENAACLNVVSKLLPAKLGKFLVLGAGACRLPYDIHTQHAPEFTVVTDINPFLFFLAKRVIEGRNVNLYEFPIAPIDKVSSAVAHKCKAAKEVKENFFFLLSDAMNPSFRKNSIDTLLTPWLIDIVPQDLRSFARRLNHILRPGGTWVNFGSLAFSHRSQTLCYSPEEVLAILSEAGFKVKESFRDEIPYMQSPASSQKRLENVFCFAAEKTSEVAQPEAYEFMPPWINDITKPVPQQQQIASIGLANKTFADIVALVDGQKSIKDIAGEVGPKLGFPSGQAEVLIKKMFANIYESSLRGNQF